MKKKRKIIKSFFGLIYCAVMSIPLVYLAINSYREYHRVNAYDNQTSALLNSDNNDAYSDAVSVVSTPLSATDNLVVGQVYICAYNGNSLSNANVYYVLNNQTNITDLFFDGATWSVERFSPSQESGMSRLIVWDTNGVQHNKFNWQNTSNSFYFVPSEIGQVPSYVTYYTFYLNSYTFMNNADDVPSSTNNIPVNYNTIVNDTITDLSFANDYLISFNIFELLGLDYSDVAWANFVNYYCQYIITLSVCLFFVEIILCFIQWCRDLVYTFTDKQEGGF